jgi:hypothetical protein
MKDEQLGQQKNRGSKKTKGPTIHHKDPLNASDIVCHVNKAQVVK